MSRAPQERRTRPIDYSTGDVPPHETEIHAMGQSDLVAVLQDHFADDPTVYVSGGINIYYEEGNPKNRVVPDVFVVRGVEKRPRDHYRLWEELKRPDLIIELTSKHRQLDDQEKLFIYRDLWKVPEIFIIDPSGGYFDALLEGFRWSGTTHTPIQPCRGPGLFSEVLGLNMARDGYALRLFEPDGRKLTTPREVAAEADSMRDQIEKARRFNRMEVELAAMRRQVAENNLLLTEAQLELAEAQLEEIKAENERLRREIDALLRR